MGLTRTCSPPLSVQSSVQSCDRFSTGSASLNVPFSRRLEAGPLHRALEIRQARLRRIELDRRLRAFERDIDARHARHTVQHAGDAFDASAAIHAFDLEFDF